MKNSGVKNIWLIPLLSVLYIVFLTMTQGIRGDQWMLVFVVNTCYFFNDYTRRFITGFSIIVIYWLIFDSMKLWPNYLFHSIDVLPLYNLEKKIFGITGNTKMKMALISNSNAANQKQACRML